MNTVEPVSKREATERLVKILDIAYAKADLEQVTAKSTQLKSEERTKLLKLLKDFEFFHGTLGDCDTEPVRLELNPDYKPFYCKYYPVHRTNKESFLKDIEYLTRIVLLTLVNSMNTVLLYLLSPRKKGL